MQYLMIGEVIFILIAYYFMLTIAFIDGVNFWSVGWFIGFCTGIIILVKQYKGIINGME